MVTHDSLMKTLSLAETFERHPARLHLLLGTSRSKATEIESLFGHISAAHREVIIRPGVLV